jgi:hypothetical protein
MGRRAQRDFGTIERVILIAKIPGACAIARGGELQRLEPV